MFRRLIAIVALLAACTLALETGRPHPASADEGMWLFSNPPTRMLEEKYGFKPTADWLEHVQRASVRFNVGGSGSFVSSAGLVMTNHHVGADALQKLSTAEHDLLKEGFQARTREEELKCLDMELNVLQSTEDVTERVNSAVKAGMSAADAQQARRAAMNTIEEESLKETGLRSDVITLYQGGRYHLYRYKRYTDVRLVFAPEQDIAFFGGDPDNFEYPRWCLDICFFRVYENDKPVEIEHYFKWSAAGAEAGELVFVSGNPGSTDRMYTVAHLKYLRDTAIPDVLNLLRRYEVLLNVYSNESTENARRARDDLFGVQNSRKARLGGLDGLQSPSVMQAKQDAEQSLRSKVQSDPKLRGSIGDPWAQISESLDVLKTIRDDYTLYEQGRAFNSRLFDIARTLVRLADEEQLANAQRLREFADAGIPSLEQALFSEAPIFDDLEKVQLADSLGYMMEIAGGDDPFVQEILAGMSPTDRAAQLIDGTQLLDVAFRRQLRQGGKQAIENSSDPLIQLAKLVDPKSRAVRKMYEEKVSEPQEQAYAKIAEAQFAAYGDSVYPDATFTLRLAFGEVKGYELGGQEVAPWTQIGGTYTHAADHNFEAPFAPPESWMKNKDKLNLDTPFNFVCTADIIGGNSGSPVINQNAEVVGIIFDGNIQSLVLDFAYTDEVARAVSVHSAGIKEALQKIYGADALVKELGN